MRQIEPLAESPASLYEHVFAPIATELLLSAVKVGLFERLEKPVSPSELAAGSGWEQKPAEVLLTGLASAGLITKQGGLYCNTAEASRFLIPGKPTYLGAQFLAMRRIFIGKLRSLPELLKNQAAGEPRPEESGGETDWAALADGMANSARAGRAQLSAGLIQGLPEFKSFSKMLDLGGGPGIACIAMVQSHPSLAGVVFDRPNMQGKAQEYISQYGLSERIEFLGGDYMTDSIGSGYDLVWASASMNFCGGELGPLMAKVHEALNPGGVFAAFQEGLTHEGTKPEKMVLPMLAWRLEGSGVSFEQGQIADAMLEAGFRSVRSKTVQTQFGPMDLDVARK